MTDPKIRPEVVALVASLVLSAGSPSHWRHGDGSELTDAEFALAKSTTEEEIQGALDEQDARGEFADIADRRQRAIDIRNHLNSLDRAHVAFLQLQIAQSEELSAILLRIEELTRPHFDQMPPGTTLDQISHMLSRAERLQVHWLFQALPRDPSEEPAGDELENTAMFDIARHVAAGFNATSAADTDGEHSPAVDAIRLLALISELGAHTEALAPEDRPPLTIRRADLIDRHGCRRSVDLEDALTDDEVSNILLTTLAKGDWEDAVALCCDLLRASEAQAEDTVEGQPDQ